MNLCLDGIKQLLPADSAMALLSAYYNSSYNLPHSSLLDHFCEWLLSCLNLNSEEGDGEATSHMATSSEPCLHDMLDAKMLNSVPALKLFTSMRPPSDVGVASHKPPPTPLSHVTSLELHREAVVYSLHLVYEVLFIESINICHLIIY